MRAGAKRDGPEMFLLRQMRIYMILFQIALKQVVGSEKLCMAFYIGTSFQPLSNN